MTTVKLLHSPSANDEISGAAVDYDFLLRAANYGGGQPGCDYSKAARQAVEAIAERIRIAAELNLKVAQERAKLVDPAKCWRNADSTPSRTATAIATKASMAPARSKTIAKASDIVARLLANDRLSNEKRPGRTVAPAGS